MLLRAQKEAYTGDQLVAFVQSLVAFTVENTTDAMTTETQSHE